jgi:hypothetical protein
MVGTIPRPQATFGELSVPATGGVATLRKYGAGLWGLVASQAAAIDQMKAAGPASTAAVVAQSETTDPAVFGSNPNGVAGLFDGQVDVTGTINCADVILKNGMSLSQLAQSLSQLEQLVQQMGITNYGQPVTAPTSRPNVSVNHETSAPGLKTFYIDVSPEVKLLRIAYTNPPSTPPPRGGASFSTN